MKAFIILVLSCAPLFAADTGIQVQTFTKTNDVSGKIYTKDVFMRDGQTNLVRTVVSPKGGMPGSAIYKFYHEGDLVGEFSAMKDYSVFEAAPGSHYYMSFMCGASKEPEHAWIYTADKVIVDAFGCTNRLLYPVGDSFLAKANADLQEARKALGKDE